MHAVLYAGAILLHNVAVATNCHFLLTLSHGHASVERGFSNNKSILKTNMSAKTVISKRLIKDHKLPHGMKPHTIEISKPKIRAFRNTHAAFKAKKKKKEEKERTRRRKE